MSYPLTSFHFNVEWGGARGGFTEVTGLTVRHDVIRYREGSSPEARPLKVPGLEHVSDLVLKRGVLAGDNEFFEWLSTVNTGTAERRSLRISVLNEIHEPVQVWRVRNAWPVELHGPVLNAMSSEVAIETLVIAHEGLVVQNG
ncbi:MAG: phage tail protein [Pseudomonadota bacterium]